MSKTFLISDTHLNHFNVLRYESRPFKDTEEMDNTIITNWNNTVLEYDKVFHLGDVGFCPKDKMTRIIKNLSGHKILILGGHDRSHSVNWWREVGFDEVYKYPIIYKKFWMLSHEPLILDKNSIFKNIHGHLHSKKLDYKGYINISVENINYTPVDFEEIKKEMVGEK